MTNLERLQNWVNEETKKGLVDIKFSPGNTSKSSIESFCASALSYVRAREQGRRTKIRGL